MKLQRIDRIEEYVLEHKSVSLDTLCKVFSVSKNTIRRDVAELLKRKTITKVYGGVSALEPLKTSPMLPYQERSTQFMENKRAICKKAAALVQEGDTIYIDTGTTCVHLVDFLTEINCTVISNSLFVLNRAAVYENLNVIAIPGRLNRKAFSFVEIDIDAYLDTYNITKAFMACTGVTYKNGLTNASAEEYIVKKSVVEHAGQCILLADHSKFGKVSLMTYATLDKMNYIVADKPVGKEYQKFCEEHGISVLIS